MPPSAPRRDRAGPALAALLAVLALPATGLLSSSWLPSTPVGFTALALATTALALLAFAAPAGWL
ncbi:MAG: hypothetical protein O2894_12425, partial [Planctomycetota bacterium]|nr:hypothetical protein [Planctomycetota bacterium]